jgi:uncharacterized protein
MLPVTDTALLLMTGLAAGSFGGLLGLGGATILVPALTLGFGLPIHLAIAVSLISNIFVSLVAVIGYRSQGLLHTKTVRVMNIASVGGVLIGTLLAAYSPASLLELAFGVFLVALVAEATLVKRQLHLGSEAEPEHIDVPAFSALGFVMGLLGGTLGIGGGSLAVPVQNALLRVPLKNAIANSLATIVVSASIGAATYFLVGAGTLFPVGESLATAAILVPGSVCGAVLATRIGHRVPVNYLRYIFYLVLLYIAINMIKSGA